MKVPMLIITAVLGGCAHTAVVDMGSGRLSLTATAPSGGYSGSREAAVEQAKEFCGQRNQAAVTDGFYDKSGLGPQGEHTSTILFRCTPARVLQF